MLSDQFSEPEPLIRFAPQDQTAVGSDPGTQKIGFERGVAGELKRAESVFRPLGAVIRTALVAFKGL
jgi:hypothetical protein